MSLEPQLDVVSQDNNKFISQKPHHHGEEEDAENGPVESSRELRQFGGAEPSHPVNPVKESPVEENPGPADDFDPHSPSERDDEDDRTIGEILEGENIALLSDDEFDVSYLERYPHTEELLECCRLSIQELAHEPYVGRQSRARVMGRAMELLREDYGQDAPRGWVPTLKRLRAKEETERRGRPQAKSYSETYVKEPEPPIPAHEILTHSFSALPNLIAGPKLCSFLETNADLKGMFVGLAEKAGVPGCWSETLPFLQFIKDQLNPVPEPLLECLDELQQRVSELRPAKPGPVELAAVR